MDTILTSVLAFISTNIDDIFILMLFYGSRRFKPATIMSGQYLGIISLIAISLIGSYIGNFLDPRYVGLLGLFPIYLAVKGFIALFKHNEEDEPDVEARATGVFSIAGVTIANGADNIGVYVPLMSTMTQVQKMEMIAISGT